MKHVLNDLSWEESSNLEKTFRDMIRAGRAKEACDMILRLFPDCSNPKVVLIRAKYRKICIDELRDREDK